MCRVLVAVSIIALSAVAALAKEPNLPTLRRHLLEGHTEEQVRQALEQLQQRIGRPKYFADHGTFGDWLATIPDGRDQHVLVLQRRGWAYMMAKRGADGLAPLEAALKQDPGSGLTRAYLGECLRLAGRYLDACEMLTSAARCGLREKYLPQGVLQSAVALRKLKPSKNAKGLPEYVRGLGMYLEVRPDELELRQTLAVWLLTDLEAYEKPTTKRGGVWAREAGSHLLEIADLSTTQATDLRRAGLFAAAAGEPELAFELLSWGVRRSYIAELDKHLVPEVLLDLAELAIARRRYSLAQQLLAQRLGLGPSPRATRLARELPADLDVR